MNEEELLAYVNASAAMLELPLDRGRAQRVALNLGRTAALARLLDGAPMAPHEELAEIYQPAPFPGESEAE